MEHLIKTYTNENDVVLDFTAGSGTTGIACINTKRNYILIEKEQKYFDIINERIKNHTNQTKLF
jgi:site-specific DNA-methyltransferase (adenine-specific)